MSGHVAFVVLESTYDVLTRSWRTDCDQRISSQEHDCTVRSSVVFLYLDALRRSVLVPWFTTREVPIDVGVVSQ